MCKTQFCEQTIKAYNNFKWNRIHLRSDGCADGGKKKENLKLFRKFQKEYPDVCPNFDYFRFVARCKVYYEDQLEDFLESYICPICKEKPKKGITNEGRNGKYKGKTCRDIKCASEMRKRTNLEKGGNTCALHRKDVRPKVINTFYEKYGTDNPLKTKKIRKKIERTLLKKTGYRNNFENPEIQEKIRTKAIEKHYSKSKVINSIEYELLDTYYQEMPIKFKSSALKHEYELIHSAIPKYEAVPKHNKIVLHYQSRLFYKKELELWKDKEIQNKLVANRIKYIGKEYGEISAWELLRGMKISGIVKDAYSHFSQQWMRKFISDYNVKSIYDPCGGWGHRLTACSKDFKYIYNDIRKPVTDNCYKIASFLKMRNKYFYSKDASLLVPNERYDSVFTCPPYWNKEKYSKKGAENKSYKDFLEWWKQVIKKSCKSSPRLFAFVISNDLESDMSEVCRKEGLKLCNKHILGRSISHFDRNRNNRSSELLLVFSL